LDEKLGDALKGLPLDDYEFRLTKYGRKTFMLVHLIVSDEFSFTKVKDLDQIREGIEDKIFAFNGEINIEILFIKDRSLAKLN
jgi:predicted Co/Zn/Cd cation transporter (cation efflux family)